jgi:Fe-S-cluster containining protein
VSRTLGQFVEEDGIVAWISAAVAEIHQFSNQQAKSAGKSLKLAVTCTSCKATKTCCWSVVTARFYEGVIIADRLKRTNRDTSEMREDLRARAEAMEAAMPQDFRTPCVFLGEGERCTIYDVRPAPCAILHVYTDPTWCTTREGEIRGYIAQEEHAMAAALEEEFRERMSLRKKVGKRYLGVLPRMVLVALETWDREDFRDHLRTLPWPGEAELARLK